MNREFFSRDTLVVAEQLIGCRMVRYLPGVDQPLIVTINETEAYKGADDPASHAFRGRTARNEVMFGVPGHLYVYFTYGMYYCMNIVCEDEGTAGAVLLRGAIPDPASLEALRAQRTLRSKAKKPVSVAAHLLLDGPAKLTQGLAIDLTHNRTDLCHADAAITILPPAQPERVLRIERTPRIGISSGQDLPWRFLCRALSKTQTPLRSDGV
jgi:DNA-3-methyladenine glycosylase